MPCCFMFFSEGGFFKAHLTFPPEYPQKPPKMKFITEMWHPNSKPLTSVRRSFQKPVENRNYLLAKSLNYMLQSTLDRGANGTLKGNKLVNISLSCS